MRFDGKTNRQRLTSIKMDEYSAVTTPAQEGARAVLMKRAEESPESGGTSKAPAAKLNKHSALIMTSSELDHQHILRLYSDEPGGSTGSSMFQIEGSEPVWHDHPWILGADGEITIGEVLGHTHEVDRDSVIAGVLSFIKVGGSDRSTPGSGKGKEKTKMAIPAKKTEGNESGAADLQKAQDRNAALLSLSAEAFAFMKTLSGDEAEAFLAAPAEQRAVVMSAAMQKAAEADPVLYKATDGTVYRKSQELLAKFARRDDEREAEMVKLRAKDEAIAFEKRAAEELPNLPGTIEVRGALLKAVQGIADEAVRGAAYLILKAKSNAIGESMKKLGHSAQSDESKFDGELSDSDAALEKMAVDYAASKGVPLAKAYQAVMQTEEGRKLYGKAHPADV